MKRFLALALVVAGTSAAVFAQAAAAPAAPKATGALVEAKVFSLEASIVAGYSLVSEDTVSGYSFILNFPVADNFAVGFQTISNASAAGTLSALKASYYISDLIGASLAFGNDGTDPFVGIGAFATPFKTASTTGFSNATRIRLDYFFPVSSSGGLSDGTVALSVGFALGL